MVVNIAGSLVSIPGLYKELLKLKKLVSVKGNHDDWVL